ncbi:Hypothetical predicted protein [Octopus vulgaris]|uniref:Uncharacterized protein n=1 Tax=Octopus vulgaris TaxID=6645 RepID=A0AA36ARL9_OCTVU|nr:Hypothetical predicted protein [Octopus vulgaris]
MATPVAVQMNLHPTMNWDSIDIVEAFKKFRRKSQLVFKSFLKGITDEEKVSYILLWTGEKGLDLFNSWDMSESDCNNPDTLLEKFERHLEPRSNHRIHRYEFQGLKQDPQETIDNFLSRLKNIAEKCKFRDKEEKIVGQLIWGCAYKEVQKSLIGKDTLQLIEAVDTARAFEATTKQMASLTLQTSSLGSSVDIVSSHRTKHTRKQRTCQYCGTEHKFNNRKKCPAFGTHCKACGKLNRWEKMCRLTKSQKYKPQFSKRSGNRRRDIHAQQQEQNTSEEEFLAVGTINVHEMGKDDQKENEAYTTIRIQKKSGKKRINIDLRLKIDTGAQSDILPVNFYKMFPEHMTEEDKIKKGILTPSDVILTAYGGDGRTKHKGPPHCKCNDYKASRNQRGDQER